MSIDEEADAGERRRLHFRALSSTIIGKRSVGKQLPLRRRRTVAKAIIDPGICGFMAEVVATMEGDMCTLEISCDCEPIQEMAKELTRVDPMEEIGFFREGPLTWRMFAKHCPHPSCPVLAGILKAVEVEAGLALPKDASIKVTRSGE